jgi:hypothetical protein
MLHMFGSDDKEQLHQAGMQPSLSYDMFDEVGGRGQGYMSHVSSTNGSTESHHSEQGFDGVFGNDDFFAADPAKAPYVIQRDANH